MIPLPNDWYRRNGLSEPCLRPFTEEDLRHEVKAAFKWPMRICSAVGIILVVATWAVM